MSTRAPLVAGLVLMCTASLPVATAQAPENPPPSAGHSLVYVDELEMVVLVNAGLGGDSAVPAASTPTLVWGWTGERWRLLDSKGPPVRNLAGVAYDSRRRVLVMHGGTFSRDRSYADTWEWNPKGGWSQFKGAGPGVRDHTQMAFDADRNRMVLFGGQANETAALGDTWEFDGARWQQVAKTGPPARVHHAMQFDPALHQVVVFGGTAPQSADLGDTWGWNGTEWRRLGADVKPRTHARMAFHRGLQQLLVFGGFDSTPVMSVMARRSNAWTPLVAASGPSARYLTDAAYDVKRNVLVLFGGGDPAGMALFADTWEFNGTAWTRR